MKTSGEKKKPQELPVSEDSLEIEEEKARKKQLRALKKVLSKSLTDENDFDLDVLDESEIQILMNALIGYIYESHWLYSYTYDGQEYFNHQSQWYHGTFEDTAWDSLTKCTGYDECEYGKGRELVRVRPEPGKKIRYTVYSNGFNEDPALYPTLAKIDEVFYSNRILHSRPLILLNSSFNDDHRGSDHTKIILDFPGKVQFTKKITEMDRFIDGLFRLRSHKFENWYEMYSETEVKLTEKAVRIKVVFDHGS